MIGPYYLNNETVGGFGVFQMLDTYGKSKAQFPQKAVSQQDGALPHITGFFLSFLEEIFLKSWIAKCGPNVWPGRSRSLTPLDFFGDS